MFTCLSRTSSQMTLQSKPPTQPFVPLSASEHSAHKLLVASSSQSLSLPTVWEWLHVWEHDINYCCAESCVFVCRIKFAFFAQFLCCLSICCLNFQRVFLLAVSFNLVCHMMITMYWWLHAIEMQWGQVRDAEPTRCSVTMHCNDCVTPHWQSFHGEHVIIAMTCGTGGMVLGIVIPEATKSTELMTVHSFLNWPLTTTAHFDHLIVVVTSPNSLTLLGCQLEWCHTSSVHLQTLKWKRRSHWFKGHWHLSSAGGVTHKQCTNQGHQSEVWSHCNKLTVAKAFWCQKSFKFQAFSLLGTPLILQLGTTSGWFTKLPKSTQSKDHLAKDIGQCPSKRCGVAHAREVRQRHSKSLTFSETNRFTHLVPVTVQSQLQVVACQCSEVSPQLAPSSSPTHSPAWNPAELPARNPTNSQTRSPAE